MVPLQDRENAQHVHFAFIYKCFAVMRNFPDHVAQVNVSDFVLLAVRINRVVNIVFRHFRQSSHAKFQHVAGAGNQVNQPLIHAGLIHQPRLLPHCRHRRIIWMRGQPHAGFFRHGNYLFQKLLQPLPKFLVGNRSQRPGRRVRIVDHVPDRPVRNRHVFRGTIHPQRHRSPATCRCGDSPTHAAEAEVVTQHRHARLADAANDRFDLFNLLRALRPIQKNVVPVRRVQILDGRKRQPGIFDFLANIFNFVRPSTIFQDRPPLPTVRISRQ